MITSPRSNSGRVAEWRIRSICSLMRGFLLDIGVGARDVGLGLVVVVVGDEILDRVVRKEALHLAVELGRQGLVRRQDQRRPLHLPGSRAAMVKVLPEPVTPSSTWSRSPARIPATISAIACGWSPAGWNSESQSWNCRRRRKGPTGTRLLDDDRFGLKRFHALYIVR